MYTYLYICIHIHLSRYICRYVYIYTEERGGIDRRGRGGAAAPVRRGGMPPHTLHPAPCTLHPTPYTLHPAPYTLHPTPCTLHPTPYTLHPTPFTLHPSPYTLQPGLRASLTNVAMQSSSSSMRLTTFSDSNCTNLASAACA